MRFILASASPRRKRITGTDRSKIQYPAGNRRRGDHKRASGRSGDGIGKTESRRGCKDSRSRCFGIRSGYRGCI